MGVWALYSPKLPIWPLMSKITKDLAQLSEYKWTYDSCLFKNRGPFHQNYPTELRFMIFFWIEVPRGFFVVVLWFVFVCETPNRRQVCICMENANFVNGQGATRADLIVCDMMWRQRPRTCTGPSFFFQNMLLLWYSERIFREITCKEQNLNVTANI